MDFLANFLAWHSIELNSKEFLHLEESAFAWLCFGHGCKCSRCENKQPFGHTSVPCTPLFSKACGVSMAVSWPRPPPSLCSGHTLAFLQAAAAEITRLGALDKGLCPATSSPWSSSLRGLMAESSGAERGWLRGVVSGQWAGLCAGLRPPAPCHSATTRQRSGDSAPGGGVSKAASSVSCCQSWPGGSPKTSERKSSGSRQNYLQEGKGAR